MNFKRGFDFEDRICTKLESIGCRLQRDQRLDHKYKLDFKVISFPDNPGTYSLGVQLTTRRDDYEKQQEFDTLHQTSSVSQKALYLELSETLDLEDGGALAVLTVIASFQFDRRFRDIKVHGVIIYPDYSYDFFDVASRARTLRENARQQFLEQQRSAAEQQRSAVEQQRSGLDQPRPVPASPLQIDQLRIRLQHAEPASSSPSSGAPSSGTPSSSGMAGEVNAVLTAWKRSDGYGFATATTGESYFVHVNAVIDDRLREELNQAPYSEIPYPVEIPLCFFDAGYTKPGAKYRAAKQVRLRVALRVAGAAAD
ncbi:MAG TPA: hypothetical protein VG345_02785 [Bryobacteraceae bacterium]|nr:hypothetical protein [Bryobacteraceae bacterium]